MTLFDTDVIIWALRDHQKALNTVDAAPDRAISAVSYMELVRGAKNAQDSLSIRKFVRMGGFQVLPVTESITAKAVSMMEALSLSNGIGPMDALVFATALDGEHILCSANYKHFKDVPGLRARRFQP